MSSLYDKLRVIGQCLKFVWGYFVYVVLHHQALVQRQGQGKVQFSTLFSLYVNDDFTMGITLAHTVAISVDCIWMVYALVSCSKGYSLRSFGSWQCGKLRQWDKSVTSEHSSLLSLWPPWIKMTAFNSFSLALLSCPSTPPSLYHPSPLCSSAFQSWDSFKE